MSEANAKSNRMIVSLQIGGFFFALANIICVAILAWTYLSVKLEPRTLDVKGSAKKAITSDTISWTGTITTYDANLAKAYEKLKADADRAAEFIKQAGVPDAEVTFSSVRTRKIMQKEVVPAVAPAGGIPAGAPLPVPQTVETNKVEMFALSQNITIESHSMDKVPGISRNITSLIKDGIEIESGSPSYTYSKLSELKIDMLADATKDATTRAEQIVNNAHGKLGKLVEAHMGVMQINPKGVNDVSDTGNNDTTSLEKEILAVVSVRFQLD
ncbi:MAG: SIMPL domain-containing protein [Phycisphaerales bacterium]|nr:SIMPL domain-containing protein [Phycisphaerales bacterium]